MQVRIEDYLSEQEIKEIVSRALFKKAFESSSHAIKSAAAISSSGDKPEVSKNGDSFYVYAIINDDFGVPFYVGKGKGSRYKDMARRSKHILAILNNYSCHSEIIENGLCERAAYERERFYKEQYKLLGYPIVDSEVVSNKDAMRAGIEKAKASGKYKGRQKMPLDVSQFKSVCARWRSGEITAVKAMEMTGLKPNTFYRRVKEYGV